MKLTLAIIGGDPARFAPYVELYKKASERVGRTAGDIGVHSPGYVVDSDFRTSGRSGIALARNAVGHT